MWWVLIICLQRQFLRAIWSKTFSFLSQYHQCFKKAYLRVNAEIFIVEQRFIMISVWDVWEKLYVERKKISILVKTELDNNNNNNNYHNDNNNNNNNSNNNNNNYHYHIIIIIVIIIIIIVIMPGYFTHWKKEASIICDDVALIMEACFNLRYCGFTRLMGFIQGSFYIWMRYWINSRRAGDRLLTFSVHFFILCSCHILVRFPLKARYWSRNVFYYIHSEKYSPKSCVVNFDTQMSASQSE